MRATEFIMETLTPPSKKEYDFRRDMITDEFIATWNGEEIGRFKAKSKFDAGAAQDAAKKCINDHFKLRWTQHELDKEREYQFEKPLSSLEQEWVALDKKIHDYFSKGGEPLSDKEMTRYESLGQIARHSLYATDYEKLHPAVKAYKDKR